MTLMMLTLHVRKQKPRNVIFSDPLMKEEIFQWVCTGMCVLQPIIKREQGQITYNGGVLFHFLFCLFISVLDFHLLEAEYWQKAKLPKRKEAQIL